ncbi:UspA domain protein [Tepidanaerobacter acetatoxydans Re1]|uniref:UspA domain protein n=1 Tax=Tepidanaerobacter acetatoxydans (strain DSM 21804 / JCM 16047 / Re1) TaxID=1209989 RepID=F4LVV0_TEPAE|nr:MULTISPECIES: universal stress protein UspA [Tepidanaerobacter]AEE90797.1 UspA domain protein [Tepidanaerobacter acetatoxydans Re1]CCP25354.1 UspA domain protein [Tepidanaerobacter acetatoxydans Re1]
MMVVFDPEVQHRIMVCVTPQKSCERLIKRGAARAREIDGQFVVIYVNKKQALNRELKEHKILLELFELAKNLGGTVSILSGEEVYDTLADFSKNNKITHIIVGKSLRSAFEIQKSGEVINPLINAVEKNGITVEVVD